MIGEAANREGCTLVTDDLKFISKLNKLNIPTMTFDEFKESVIE
jgi:rRNA-processing protein FCF1